MEITTVTVRTDYKILRNDLFEQEQMPSHEDFIVSIFKAIVADPSKMIWFVSIPETHDHALIIQLFNHISKQLGNPSFKDSHTGRMFAKKSGKKEYQESPKQRLLESIAQLISVYSELQSKKLQISVSNCAALIGTLAPINP